MRDRKPILRPRYGTSHAAVVAAMITKPKPEPEVAERQRYQITAPTVGR